MSSLSAVITTPRAWLASHSVFSASLALRCTTLCEPTISWSRLSNRVAFLDSFLPFCGLHHTDDEEALGGSGDKKCKMPGFLDYHVEDNLSASSHLHRLSYEPEIQFCSVDPFPVLVLVTAIKLALINTQNDSTNEQK